MSVANVASILAVRKCRAQRPILLYQRHADYQEPIGLRYCLQSPIHSKYANHRPVVENTRASAGGHRLGVLGVAVDPDTSIL